MSAETLEERWGITRQLDRVATEDQLQRLFHLLTINSQRHKKTDDLYKSADSCGHDIPQRDDPEWDGDDVHVWGGWDEDTLICLASPSGEKVCLCGEYGCDHEISVRNAREEFWEMFEAQS